MLKKVAIVRKNKDEFFQIDVDGNIDLFTVPPTDSYRDIKMNQCIISIFDEHEKTSLVLSTYTIGDNSSGVIDENVVLSDIDFDELFPTIKHLIGITNASAS